MTNIARPVPPGLTEADLDRALAALVAAIGDDKVAIDRGTLADFEDPFQFAGAATNLASGVVSPTTVEEVQAIVRIANEHRLPLWPIGRGKNNGYGGASTTTARRADARLPEHEPGPRDQRRARLCHR